eukprot:UN19650
MFTCHISKMTVSSNVVVEDLLSKIIQRKIDYSRIKIFCLFGEHINVISYGSQ